MVSVGIRGGGSDTLPFRQFPIGSRNPNRLPSCSLRFSANKSSMSSIKSQLQIRTDSNVKQGSGDGNRNTVVYERLIDGWMRDSVGEIVKNLREAPLIVHVYSEEKKMTLKTEKAVVEESWGRLIDEWKDGTEQKPEGVIFVESLEDDDQVETTTEGVTKAWGVVVQGRGGGGGGGNVACGPPACYLLKTSTAGVGPGMGLCSTHFCLVKVKNFMETTSSQLKNCWLARLNSEYA